MLIPFERMRVGINSESASKTHTPGPMAKNAMKTKMGMATSQPLRVLGTGLIKALSIRSGACREASKLLNGFEKNATTLFAGKQLWRAISIGFAAGSSERATLVAARKSPQEYITINDVGRFLRALPASPFAARSFSAAFPL